MKHFIYLISCCFLLNSCEKQAGITQSKTITEQVTTQVSNPLSTAQSSKKTCGSNEDKNPFFKKARVVTQEGIEELNLALLLNKIKALDENSITPLVDYHQYIYNKMDKQSEGLENEFTGYADLSELAVYLYVKDGDTHWRIAQSPFLDVGEVIIDKVDAPEHIIDKFEGKLSCRMSAYWKAIYNCNGIEKGFGSIFDDFKYPFTVGVKYLY